MMHGQKNIKLRTMILAQAVWKGKAVPVLNSAPRH